MASSNNAPPVAPAELESAGALQQDSATEDLWATHTEQQADGADENAFVYFPPLTADEIDEDVGDDTAMMDAATSQAEPRVLPAQGAASSSAGRTTVGSSDPEPGGGSTTDGAADASSVSSAIAQLSRMMVATADGKTDAASFGFCGYVMCDVCNKPLSGKHGVTKHLMDMHLGGRHCPCWALPLIAQGAGVAEPDATSGISGGASGGGSGRGAMSKACAKFMFHADDEKEHVQSHGWSARATTTLTAAMRRLQQHRRDGIRERIKEGKLEAAATYAQEDNLPAVIDEWLASEQSAPDAALPAASSDAAVARASSRPAAAAAASSAISADDMTGQSANSNGAPRHQASDPKDPTFCLTAARQLAQLKGRMTETDALAAALDKRRICQACKKQFADKSTLMRHLFLDLGCRNSPCWMLHKLAGQLGRSELGAGSSGVDDSDSGTAGPCETVLYDAVAAKEHLTSEKHGWSKSDAVDVAARLLKFQKFRRDSIRQLIDDGQLEAAASFAHGDNLPAVIDEWLSAEPSDSTAALPPAASSSAGAAAVTSGASGSGSGGGGGGDGGGGGPPAALAASGLTTANGHRGSNQKVIVEWLQNCKDSDESKRHFSSRRGATLLGKFKRWHLQHYEEEPAVDLPSFILILERLTRYVRIEPGDDHSESNRYTLIVGDRANAGAAAGAAASDSRSAVVVDDDSAAGKAAVSAVVKNTSQSKAFRQQQTAQRAVLQSWLEACATDPELYWQDLPLTEVTLRYVKWHTATFHNNDGDKYLGGGSASFLRRLEHFLNQQDPLVTKRTRHNGVTLLGMTWQGEGPAPSTGSGGHGGTVSRSGARSRSSSAARATARARLSGGKRKRRAGDEADDEEEDVRYSEVDDEEEAEDDEQEDEDGEDEYRDHAGTRTSAAFSTPPSRSASVDRKAKPPPTKQAKLEGSASASGASGSGGGGGGIRSTIAVEDYAAVMRGIVREELRAAASFPWSMLRRYCEVRDTGAADPFTGHALLEGAGKRIAAVAEKHGLSWSAMAEVCYD